MQQPIEQYLKRLKEQYGYTEEQLETVKEFRESAELLNYEQYRYLVENNLVYRTIKLKKPRNIYFKDDKLWYLNHYHKCYNYIGWLHSEEFLEQRAKEEAEKRRLIEEARAEKKRLKAEKIAAEKQFKEEVTKLNKGFQEVKKKRPRIKK